MQTKYSILRNRRGYLFQLVLLMAFVFALPALSHALVYECFLLAAPNSITTAGAGCPGSSYPDSNSMDDQGYFPESPICGDHDYSGNSTNSPAVVGRSNGTWYNHGNIMFRSHLGVGSTFASVTSAAGGIPVYQIPSGYTPSASYTCEQAQADYAPADPCDDYETEVDFDADGICDRCDMNPQDKDEGKYVWLMFTYSESGSVVAQDYSIISPSDFVNLPVDTAENYLYTAAAGNPDSDIDLSNAFVTLNFDSAPAAEMQACACDVPCTLSTLLGSNMIPGDYEFTGTAMTPETPPEITLEGSTAERTFLTPDAPGEHGTTIAGSAAPGTGSTDNEFLESIAGNQTTVANNLDSVGNILDAELNALNANTARTAGNVAETNEFLKDQAEDDTLSTSDGQGIIDSVGQKLDTFGQDLIDGITSDVTTLSETEHIQGSWFDGLSSDFSDIFTTSECVDLDYYIPSIDKTISLSCDVSVKIKVLLGFLFAVYTIMSLMDTLYRGVSPKGSSDLSLWG